MFEVNTYEQDLKLFKKLGFKPFKDLPTHKKYFVGEYSNEDGTVRVWVTPTPSHSWEFQIDSELSKKQYVVETGTGALSSYWPHVEAMLGDMFVVNGVFTKPDIKRE